MIIHELANVTERNVCEVQVEAMAWYLTLPLKPLFMKPTSTPELSFNNLYKCVAGSADEKGLAEDDVVNRGIKYCHHKFRYNINRIDSYKFIP
jgi:hypothetical protein